MQGTLSALPSALSQDRLAAICKLPYVIMEGFPGHLNAAYDLSQSSDKLSGDTLDLQIIHKK